MASARERMVERIARLPPWLDVVLVVGIAAALRFTGLDLAPWDHNQAEILKLVDPIVDRGEWPAVGWEISGRFGGALPALLFWLLALPRFVTLSPIVLIGFGAAFDVVAAGIACLLGRLLFGRTAGLLAGLLYALDAALVGYAQTLWNVTMVPCFTALLLLGLALVLVEGRSWGIVLAIVAMAVLLQLHFVAGYLLPPALVLLLAFRPRIRPRHAALGMGLALLLFAPYLVHELRNDLPNLRAAGAIVRSVFGAADVPAGVDAAPASFNRDVLERGATLRGVDFPSWPVRHIPRIFGLPPFVHGYRLAEVARAALALLGAAALVWRLARSGADPSASRRSRRVAALLLVSFAVPLAVLALARFRIYERYLLPLYPLPMLLAVAWLPELAELRRRAPSTRTRRAAVAAATAAGMLLAAIAAAHLEVLRQTRAEARETGLVNDDATVGTKLDLARFFLEDVGLDAPAFVRDTSFFAWPGAPAPDRHRGFVPLFRYLLEERHVARRLDRPRGSRYLVLYRGEDHQLISELISSEIFARERFTVVRLDEAVRVGYARHGGVVPEDWWRTGGGTESWRSANFPLSWGDQTALEHDVAVQYLEVPLTVTEERPHARFLLHTRECVEWVSLDGERVSGETCAEGRAGDEREAVVRDYPLEGRLAVGEHVLRVKLVVRYSTASIDGYVLTFQSARAALQRPPEEIRFGRYLAPDPRRFRVPPDHPPESWVPVGLPVVDERKLAGWVSKGPDTEVASSLGPRRWSGPTWQLEYSLGSPASYVVASYAPYPRHDFRGYRALALALHRSGSGGSLRIALRDRDGDEWVYFDDAALWDDGWLGLALPLGAFRRDPGASQGNGQLDLSHIEAVMFQIIPGEVRTPVRDQVLWLTPPVLLRDLPDRRG